MGTVTQLGSKQSILVNFEILKNMQNSRL